MTRAVGTDEASLPVRAWPFIKNGPRLGKPSFPPVPTAPEKEPPPKAQPEGNLKTPAKQPSPTISCVLPLPPHPLPGEN